MSTTPYLDRAREINRRMIMEIDQENARHAMKHIGAALLLCIVGLGVAKALPINETAKTYDLVQYHGLESDIIDFDLSIDDCAVILPTMRAAGDNVECSAN